MQVNTFHIQKNDEFKIWGRKYAKLISKFANLKEHNLSNRKIAVTQNLSAQAARLSHEEAPAPYTKGLCIALDERGREFTSVEFAKLIADKNNLNFFIGGAYGLRDEFGQSLDFRFPLSKFTLAHQFVKILLLEQTYHASCINSDHPYYK